MNSSQLKDQFWQQGFVILTGFFSNEELADIVSVMEGYERQLPQYEEKQGTKRRPGFEKFETSVVNFGVEAAHEDAFIRLGDHYRMTEATKTIIGEGFEKEGLLVMYSTKGNGQGWHRDCYNENPNHYMVNRLIYTKDIDPKAGALYVVPGSHKLNQFTSGGMHDSIEGEVMVAPEKGTLVLVHSSTFHRVYKNETDRPRVSVNYRVRPQGAPKGLGKVGVYRTGNWNFVKNEEESD